MEKGKAMSEFEAWIGKQESAKDVFNARIRDGLIATLDIEKNFPQRTGKSPVASHWCLAPQIAPMSKLGRDGHPQKGGFLPPVPLPRRMWAGGRVNILGEIPSGAEVTRLSTIKNIALKTGSTGQLYFVTIRHEYSANGALLIDEEQDLVYRADDAGVSKNIGTPPSSDSLPPRDYSIVLNADAVTMFRYSALTFNGHRIHYDRKYAIEVENYAGLVYHGPLQATLLLEFAANIKNGAAPKYFEYRGLKPLIDGNDFTLNAKAIENGLELWVEDFENYTTMKAKAIW